MSQVDDPTSVRGIAMNTHTIYNRLQGDIARTYGFEPQLAVSRIALYEQLWKDILGTIEFIGDSIPDLTWSRGRDYMSLLSERESTIPAPARDPIGVLSCRVDGIGRETFIVVPLELVPLVSAFYVSRNASYLKALRQICLFTYKSKSSEIHENTCSKETIARRDLPRGRSPYSPREEISLGSYSNNSTRSREQLLPRTNAQASNYCSSDVREAYDLKRKLAITGFLGRNTKCHGLSKSYYERQARGDSDTSKALALSRILFNIVLDPVDWRNITPSHGPGAVSDSSKGIDKWKTLDSRTTRLCDKFYPLAEYNVPTPEWFNHSDASYADSICKLAVVPKDKRGPRIICTQPTGLMWIQQGQLREVNRAIMGSPILKTNRGLISPGVSSSIRFDKQEQNGSLALEASRSREFATIDLKDASDLISWGLVRFLCNKENARFLAASRAMYVRTPENELVKLHMFAPMGSAMCFPVESLVFWVIATAATIVQRGWMPDILRCGCVAGWLSQNLSEVFVFGDDILVRRESCKFVCECLESVGLVVNRQKTFTEGFYRESCGVDAYRGERLDIARLQCPTLTSMSDAYATIDLCNRLRRLGMCQLSEYLECQVESFLGFGLAAGLTGGALWSRDWPCNAQGARMALSWNLRHNKVIRFNPNLQYWEAKSVIAVPRTLSASQDDRCRLFRGLTSGVDEHTMDWLVPDQQQYHLGWVKAF